MLILSTEDSAMSLTQVFPLSRILCKIIQMKLPGTVQSTSDGKMYGVRIVRREDVTVTFNAM